MNLHQDAAVHKSLKGKKIISSFLAGALLLGGFSPALATSQGVDNVVFTAQSADDYEGLEEFLYFIEQIPDEVFESDEKYYQYLEQNLPSVSVNSSSGVSPSGLSFEEDVNGLGCFAAAGAAVIGLFPPAKIFKVRSVIKSAGGVKTFVEKLKSHSKDAKDRGVVGRANMEYSLKNAAGDAWPDVQDALLDFFGIAGVAAACGITWE